MEKIVIIGSPGAGKSTLARKLKSILKIKVVHLDRIFWRPGWIEKPRDIRIEILDKIVQEKRWIIEGTYLSLSKPRLDAADTIIFLDIDPLICLRQIFQRHQIYKPHPENHGRIRRDIQQGCTDKLTLPFILKVLGFPFQGRRTLKQKLHYYKTKQIIWLHTTKEVEDFLAVLESHTDKKMQFSKTPSIAGKKPFGHSKIITSIYQPQ
jgi:hypothetical protein